jgi:hypothetical protein
VPIDPTRSRERGSPGGTEPAGGCGAGSQEGEREAVPRKKPADEASAAPGDGEEAAAAVDGEEAAALVVRKEEARLALLCVSPRGRGGLTGVGVGRGGLTGVGVGQTPCALLCVSPTPAQTRP